MREEPMCLLMVVMSFTVTTSLGGTRVSFSMFWTTAKNDSEAAMPTAYCSDFLTFRGKGKQEGVQVDDFDIREDLEKIQPAPIDIKGTISPEDVTGVAELPQGVCTGELIAASNTTATTTSPS